jgi:FAD-linked sulfhydryl oxidase
MAAVYPENPTDEEQHRMLEFIRTLSKIYPCRYCAKDFEESVVKRPPDVASREKFSLWMCDLHNEVNEKLGKPIFLCQLETIDKRWKDGDASCWEVGEKKSHE